MIRRLQHATLAVLLIGLLAPTAFADPSPAPPNLPTPQAKPNPQIQPQAAPLPRARRVPAKKGRPQKKPNPAKLKANIDARKASIERFLRAHTQRLAREELEPFLADFIPNHPQRKTLRALAIRAFARYDLEVSIESLTIVETNPNTARVTLVQRTRRTPTVKDPVARPADERAELRYLLRMVNKKWKIQSTERLRLDDPQGDD